MNEHESEFEDPGLKAAVRRTAGREAAPPSLRAKVQSLVAAQLAGGSGGTGDPRDVAVAGNSSGQSAPVVSSPAGGRRRLVVGRDVWRTAAVAACVLLALGWLAYQVRENLFPPSPYANGPGGGRLTAIPASLVLDVVRAHDDCAKLADHHKIPGDDPEKLRERLTAGAGVAASTVSLGGDWKFKGAGICAVGEKQAAHLLFVRADEFVSIFSMTATDECGYGADSYTDMIDNRPVGGFRHGDALYCVVISGGQRPLSEDDLNPVLAKMQAAVATGCTTHETMTASAAAAAPAAAESPESTAKNH